MYEIVGVRGNIIRLDELPEEEKKKALAYEITELLELFGPMKRQLLVRYFTERHAMIVVECLKSMERVKKVASYEDYYTTDSRLFDTTYFTSPKINGEVNTFENIKNFNGFLEKLELRQKAFAVFLNFREFGAQRWYLGSNPMKPWLILSFVAREKLFHVVYVTDFNAFYANDITADPREIRDRLALIYTDEDKKGYTENQVQGVKAYVKVDENYHVVIKKP